MIAYASRTGTKSTIARMEAAGWRALISPKGMTNPLQAHDLPYALDNGAWWSHQNGQPFDADAFEFALQRFGLGADWIVIPDIVASPESLAFSRLWHADLSSRPRLAETLLLLAVQDGMTPPDIVDLIGPRVGIFVGGSTDWKLATLADWCEFAHSRGAYSHVARVNSTKRISMCIAAGADSFDGTSVTQFPVTLAKLDGARPVT